MLASHLDPKLFSEEQTSVASRDGYGEGLCEAAKRDAAVVALAADLTESTRTHIFAEAFPERFVQVGITEQNMASVASGMAAMGKIPFIASYAMFSPGRNWEQIRTTIAYNNANVKIIGAHAGISVGPDGATHQAIEDIALMRVIPNMIVLAPCDIHEARKATMWAAQHEGPVYIRVGRSTTPVVTTPESPFTVGEALPLWTPENPTVSIFVTGTLSYEALVAAKQLTKEGTVTQVIHMASIKPLDTDALAAAAKASDLVVTVEEHQAVGGLGGAVAEYLSSTTPVPVLRIGINDRFGQSGEPTELLSEYQIDAAGIASQITKRLNS